MIDIDKVKFDEKGLMPAVVQEANGKVLMLAYMNKESLQKTIETGYTWFYSRSRQELWNKGATSGNKQSVSEIYYDCDGDTLLVKVHQTGMACHTGTYTCFTDRRLFPDSKDLVPMAQPQDNTSIAKVLNDLYATIKDRQVNPVEGSYTNYLFEKGQDKILKKVGEECTETIIASKNMDKEEILYEMSDLWYHCLVLLAYHNITPDDLLAELMSRRNGGEYHRFGKKEIKKNKS